jgi:hypothetical protein
VTGDLRPVLAREHLDAAQRTPVEQLPPLVLARECAESRRHLAALLTVIEGQATAPGADQLATVLAALEDASAWRKLRGTSVCQACAQHPAELCEDHAADLDRAEAYDRLAATLREARP